jgi:hypothetical protein
LPTTGASTNVACIKCHIGLYQDTSGASACKPCLVGKHMKPSETSRLFESNCELCPASTYQNETGKTACVRKMLLVSSVLVFTASSQQQQPT